MHQRHNISIGAQRWITRLALPATLVVVLLAQITARSEAVMRSPIDQQLESLAYTLNGRLSVGTIEPAGLWGVDLLDVEFRPHMVAPTGGDRPLVTIDRVRVRPNVASLLTATPSLELVVIDHPVLEAVVDSQGGPHAEWFEWLTHEVRGQGNDGDPTTEAGNDPARDDAVAALIARLPRVEVRNGLASFDDPSGRYPSMGARVEQVAYSPATADEPPSVAGEILLEGLGRGAITGTFADGERHLALRLLDQNNVFPLLPVQLAAAPDAQLSVGSVRIDWPPRIAFADVRASGLANELPAIPGRFLDEISAQEMRIQFEPEGVDLSASQVRLQFGGDGRPHLDIHSASARRGWAESNPEGALRLVDHDGDLADVVIRRPNRAEIRASVQARDFDIGPLVDLAPASVQARVLAGDYTGTALAIWNANSRQIQLRTDGALDSLSIDSPLLSSEPIRQVDMAIEGAAQIWPETGAILIERTRLLFPDFGLYMNASASHSEERTTVDLHLSLPPRPAQELLDAMPAGVADALIGFRLGGDLGFDAVLAVDSNDLDSTVAELEFFADDFEVLEFGPLAPIDQLTDSEFTWVVHTFDDTTRRIGPGDESWVPLDSLAALTYRAAVAAEDDRFWVHNGFDENGIRAALRANLEAGRVVRGGSTITQQVVKNLFLNHDRTLARKLQEAFLTWQLEQSVSKDRILELYFNLVHYGPGIYGIRDAAMAYFNHVPAQLTLRESAFLAAILPNPALFGEQYTQGVISPSRRTKMRNVLNNLHGAGYLSSATLRYHANLIDRGVISNTPVPRELGVHDSWPDSPTIDRIGALFFE